MDNKRGFNARTGKEGGLEDGEMGVEFKERTEELEMEKSGIDNKEEELIRKV